MVALKKIEFWVALIDPTKRFLNSTQNLLSQNLSSGDFKVKSFQKTNQYIARLENLNSSAETPTVVIPIVVIADSAARSIQIEKSIFVLTRQQVPRATCIAYTASPSDDYWSRLIPIGIRKRDHIIRRPHEENRLLQVVREVEEQFENSDDYRRFTSLWEQMQKSTEIDESKQKLLIEAARATDKGLRFLYRKKLSEQRESTDDKEKHETGTPKMNYKPDATLINTIIRPNSYVGRLLERPRLNFLDKIIIKDVARCKFVRLSRNNKLELAKSFKVLFLSQQYPQDKESWQIIREIFNEVFARSTRI